jgi:hypothetical protein
MGRCKHIIFKLLIVLISVFFIDGGKSLLIVSNNLQIIINKDNTKDVEIPDQHHTVAFSADEKWIDGFSFDSCFFNFSTVKFLSSFNTALQEFTDSIWQPPRFV